MQINPCSNLPYLCQSVFIRGFFHLKIFFSVLSVSPWFFYVVCGLNSQSLIMSTAPWTVGRLLQWTTDYLKDHGSESPRLDAEVLLAEALGCQRIELYTAFDNEPDEETRKKFRALVRRRADGAPVAYLVGRREFYSLAFRVTPDVLIPRPETELLVVAALDLAKTTGEGGRGKAEEKVTRGQWPVAGEEPITKSQVTSPPSPFPLLPKSPTSARAAALSPSAWPSTCPPAASQPSTSAPPRWP